MRPADRDPLGEFERLVTSLLPPLLDEALDTEKGQLHETVMARVERPLLRQALELAGGNQLGAARLLGINRNTLRKRLRLFGLLPASRPRAASPDGSTGPAPAADNHPSARATGGPPPEAPGPHEADARAGVTAPRP